MRPGDRVRVTLDGRTGTIIGVWIDGPVLLGYHVEVDIPFPPSWTSLGLMGPTRLATIGSAQAERLADA